MQADTDAGLQIDADAFPPLFMRVSRLRPNSAAVGVSGAVDNVALFSGIWVPQVVGYGNSASLLTTKPIHCALAYNTERL
jgi:hypothetical protein